MKITPDQLYKRQITLSEIGEKGQKKLMQTKVVVMGCGGLGSAVAVYLAASGIGSLHLVDFDKISLSNLHRQVFYKVSDIEKLKVDILAKHISGINPLINVSTHAHAIIKDTIFDLIAKGDFIVDCTDSLIIKYLINDACVLKEKPLIYGSLYKFDGYVASFNIKTEGGSFSANLRDFFPEISKIAVPNCSEVGTLNTIVGIIGLMQANEVLKMVTQIGKPLIDKLLIYNSLDNTQFLMKMTQTSKKRLDTKKQIEVTFKKEAYLDPSCELQDEALLIEAVALRKKLLHGEATQKLKLISVIEEINIKLPFQVHQKIPFSTLDLEKIDFSNDNEYIIVCKKGISSYSATQKIKEKHPDIKVLSLKNGILNY